MLERRNPGAARVGRVTEEPGTLRVHDVALGC